MGSRWNLFLFALTGLLQVSHCTCVVQELWEEFICRISYSTFPPLVVHFCYWSHRQKAYKDSKYTHSCSCPPSVGFLLTFDSALRSLFFTFYPEFVVVTYRFGLIQLSYYLKWNLVSCHFVRALCIFLLLIFVLHWKYILQNILLILCMVSFSMQILFTFRSSARSPFIASRFPDFTKEISLILWLCTYSLNFGEEFFLLFYT